jgi:putative transposase
MKRSRYTKEKIIGILQEQESGAAVAELCRKHGGHEVGEAKRLRALETENTKLKRLLADAMLDNAALKDLLGKKMVAPAACREAVAHLRGGFAMSGRACRVVVADRSSVRYRRRVLTTVCHGSG